MKSLNGNSYVAACIDDMTHKSKMYFQQKKSQLFESYKKDEAYIETQSGHQIKASHSDQGGEFQSEGGLHTPPPILHGMLGLHMDSTRND